MFNAIYNWTVGGSQIPANNLCVKYHLSPTPIYNAHTTVCVRLDQLKNFKSSYISFKSSFIPHILTFIMRKSNISFYSYNFFNLKTLLSHIKNRRYQQRWPWSLMKAWPTRTQTYFESSLYVTHACCSNGDVGLSCQLFRVLWFDAALLLNSLDVTTLLLLFLLHFYVAAIIMKRNKSSMSIQTNEQITSCENEQICIIAKIIMNLTQSTSQITVFDDVGVHYRILEKWKLYCCKMNIVGDIMALSLFEVIRTHNRSEEGFHRMEVTFQQKGRPLHYFKRSRPSDGIPKKNEYSTRSLDSVCLNFSCGDP